ncbi:MAG TPA: hypothetical protein VF101_13785 [Gaiellaceae bacterium]
MVHLRAEVGQTLCGIDTSQCGDYMSGPADADFAPEPTCAVCIERQDSDDVVEQLLAAARQVSKRRRRGVRLRG